MHFGQAHTSFVPPTPPQRPSRASDRTPLCGWDGEGRRPVPERWGRPREAQVLVSSSAKLQVSSHSCSGLKVQNIHKASGETSTAESQASLERWRKPSHRACHSPGGTGLHPRQPPQEAPGSCPVDSRRGSKAVFCPRSLLECNQRSHQETLPLLYLFPCIPAQPLAGLR